MAYYKIDHKGISDMLSSQDMKDALRAAGDDVIALAKEPLGKFTADDWHNDDGPPRVQRGYPRATRMVVNDHPAAAAREFGSGRSDNGRPQGGSNEPTRALGKAGRRIGDYKAGGLQEP